MCEALYPLGGVWSPLRRLWLSFAPHHHINHVSVCPSSHSAICLDHYVLGARHAKISEKRSLLSQSNHKVMSKWKGTYAKGYSRSMPKVFWGQEEMTVSRKAFQARLHKRRWPLSWFLRMNMGKGSTSSRWDCPHQGTEAHYTWVCRGNAAKAQGAECQRWHPGLYIQEIPLGSTRPKEPH